MAGFLPPLRIWKMLLPLDVVRGHVTLVCCNFIETLKCVCCKYLLHADLVVHVTCLLIAMLTAVFFANVEKILQHHK